MAPLNPQDAFAWVTATSMEEFEMPRTNAIPDLMNLLGIPVTEGQPIAALPINVVPAKPTTPSCFHSLAEDLDVEYIL